MLHLSVNENWLLSFFHTSLPTAFTHSHCCPLFSSLHRVLVVLCSPASTESLLSSVLQPPHSPCCPLFSSLHTIPVVLCFPASIILVLQLPGHSLLINNHLYLAWYCRKCWKIMSSLLLIIWGGRAENAGYICRFIVCLLFLNLHKWMYIVRPQKSTILYTHISSKTAIGILSFTIYKDFFLNCMSAFKLAILIYRQLAVNDMNNISTTRKDSGHLIQPHCKMYLREKNVASSLFLCFLNGIATLFSTKIV